jgi:hypothetical protein
VPAPTLPTGVIPASGVYLSEFLLESVKRRTRMPLSQATLDTWDVLRVADEQIVSYVAPLMISEAEDYLTAVYDVAITPGVTSFRPPARSMKLREVQFLDEDGDVADVPRIALENLPYAAWGFYLLGESVKIVNPEQFAGLSIRFTYYLRPSKLIPGSEAGIVSSVADGVITLYGATLAATTAVDLIRGVAPFEVVAMDVPATVSGTTVTVDASAIPSGFGAGDFVCKPQECPGVQVHPDLFALVAQATAVSILDGNGDSDSYARAKDVLSGLDAGARVLLSQRVEGEPIPVGGGFNPIWDRSWARGGHWTGGAR